MNIQDINLELLSELEIPKYHDYFVASQLNKGFSFQMRALRANQDLTQKGLAELAGTKQSVISRTETNGLSNLSVKTLLKLASAFNVGLVLRFVSLDHLLDWKNPISLEELAPKKSKDILEKIKILTTRLCLQRWKQDSRLVLNNISLTLFTEKISQ